MNRREATIALVTLGAAPLAVEAQQGAKVARIDLKTAKSLGLAIPKSVLLRADSVIE